MGQLDSNQHSELQRLAACRLADVPVNGAGGRIRTCKPRRAAALQAVELVVPDLLSADMVDLEGIAPSFPVCDAGVFLLDDKPG